MTFRARTNPRRNAGTTTGVSRKRPNLERQAISFTVGLYLFICAALLAVHYAAPDPGEPGVGGSSSISPYNP